MRGRIAWRLAAAGMLAMAAALPATGQSLGGKEITALRPGKSVVRLFVDPELTQAHAVKSITASAAGFPRPVLEEAPNGAMRTFFKTGTGEVDGWVHPQDVKSDLRADADCLVAQQTPGPLGAVRGANEGCVAPPAAGPGGKKK